MAKKIDLSISTKYVPDWTYLDAIREFLQNAKDREIENPDAKMFVGYNKITQALTISNAHTSLQMDSILIGNSTKSNDSSTIGKHGEGYKLGLMVLAREKKPVVIKNMFYNQEWKCRIVKSRTFNDFEIPSIFIEDKEFNDDDLVIEVRGITEEMYDLIVSRTLFLQDDIGKVVSTPNGDILLHERYKGKLFVEGLYICDTNDTNYGYNFKAYQVNLDRDRRLVSGFDLSWNTSAMWSYAEDTEKLFDLINKNSIEIRYISKFISEGTARKLFAMYDRQYGQKEEKVDPTEEFKATDSKLYFVSPERINDVSASAKASGRIAVSCPDSFLEMIEKFIPEYDSKLNDVELTTKDKLQQFYDDIKYKLTNNECKTMEEIIEQL